MAAHKGKRLDVQMRAPLLDCRRIFAQAPLAGLHPVQLISLTYLTGTLKRTE